MTPQDHERMLELACDRALVGLSLDGEAELEALLGAPLDGRALDVEVAAAAITLSQLGAVEPLSQAAAERAFQAAQATFAARGATVLMAPEAQA
ncbi:MAG TPA: hypothetical protein VHB21_17990, partial [Minicystis sp.]|nr:hypothetical protein [Minicystis sp.]